MSINYRQADKVLDRVESVFGEISEEKELNQETIERWRWDQPEIRLSWTGDDNIERNITGVIQHSDNNEYSVDFEINAWIDSDRVPEDMVSEEQVRYWHHQEVQTSGPTEGQAREVVYSAFTEVDELTQDDLNRTEPLS